MSSEQEIASLERWKREFKALSYPAQLAYLTTLSKRPRGLYGSDTSAASVMAAQFKPLLKIPGSKAVGGTPTRPKPTRARSSRSTDELRQVIVDLIRRHPRQLSPMQCLALLTGDAVDATLRTHPSYGVCSRASPEALGNSLQSLLDRDVLKLCSRGKLELLERL